MALSQVYSKAQGLALPNTAGFVPGQGATHPRLILVGEAPGETELPTARPFTGRAGVKLDLMLAALGLTRQEVFITMAFHRRPTRMSPSGRTVNRPPTKAEMLAEGFLLDAELAALPQVPLLLMGNTALWRLYRGQVKDWHGQVLHAPLNRVVAGALVPGPMRRFGVTAHPAALLYRQATQAMVLADLAQLKPHLLLEATH
ncbi:uracil-DNA glycosylase [Lacticaseibacillus daqingensis]|uniref:uracil-DNA glycosylase n=1 Tax=Lacticaseibacillus daqingensis TaxID=2486014 RepID=UPI000F781568|nr:uracil-DNA glycosylase [Lacticaseibacillus daqingensis]